MGKDHLARLAAPKTWHIDRKSTTFITKPVPGSHGLQSGMPINVILKEILKYASTTKEVKKILNTNEVKVDGKARKDFRFPVGLFDTLEFPNISEQFRIMLNKGGRLELIKIKKEEASVKPCKIVGKTMVKGKLQLNLYDGRNVLVEKDSFKTGDSVLLKLPEQEIKDTIKLEKGTTVLLTAGKHIGDTGVVEDIIGRKAKFKLSNGDVVETPKDYVFPVGKGESVVKIG